jgi:hypothetical protein
VAALATLAFGAGVHGLASQLSILFPFEAIARTS